MGEIRSKINSMFTLNYLVKEDENKYFDRKSANIKPSSIADTISAFANAEGGTIVFGISDERKLEGINFIGKDKINCLINAPKDYCKPMPCFEDEFIDITNEKGEKDRLLLLHIKPSVDRIIYTTKDSVFLRIGDRKKEIKGFDIRNLEYSKNERHYESECDTDATIDDLDEQLVQE